MIADEELSQLPPPLRRVLSPEAPPQLRLMAARGVVPGARPADLLLLLALLADGEDGGLARQATQTLAGLPAPVLSGALTATLAPRATLHLARHYALDAELVEQLLRQPQLSGEALELLAERADERRGELIATNEQRLLEHPKVIEKLYLNRSVRMSTADRLIDLAVRNGLTLDLPAFDEAAAAITGELIVEAQQEPTFDDQLFQEVTTAAIALEHAGPELEDTHDVNEDGEETVRQKFLPIHAQIAQMTITQKIRKATLGTASERMLLVRDPNRLVAAAAVKSPLMRENEAAMVSSSRAVSEEVLRLIAMNREFTRSYQVKLNLVSNPRTPLSFATRMVPHLRDVDLKKLSLSKNVTGAVQTAVRQQMARKKAGKS